MNGFNSVFKKNFLSMACLLVIAVTLLTVIFSIFLANYSASEKQDQLELAMALAERSFEMGDGQVADTLQATADIYKLSVVVADASGRIFLDFAASGQERTDFGQRTSIDANLLQYLLPEQGLYMVGTMADFYKEKSAVLAKRKDSFRYGTVYIFLASGMSSLDSAFQQLSTLLVLTAILILGAASVVTFLSTARLVRPLVELRNAARGFARGEFDRRVTVYGNDEVAELSDAFNKMADSLAKNEQIRSEFIANISHELKTPMTTIAGFADGMLDGTIPPERREEYLQTIGSETRRLSRLVNKLLLTSRIDAGRQEIHPTRINICDIIGRCAIGLEKQIEEKGLDVELDFADDRVFVQADADAVMQIMYNLIDNAQKYADHGGKLRVSVAKKSGLCEISVYNTGCGIPLEDLPHVFDRFYKVDKSRGLAKDSFGLGLYIVRTLVNRHGQEIYARSSPGEYAEFTFALKLDKQKNDPETVARLAEHEEDTRLQ